jgi:hypothetical protein
MSSTSASSGSCTSTRMLDGGARGRLPRVGLMPRLAPDEPEDDVCARAKEAEWPIGMSTRDRWPSARKVGSQREERAREERDEPSTMRAAIIQHSHTGDRWYPKSAPDVRERTRDYDNISTQTQRDTSGVRRVWADSESVGLVLQDLIPSASSVGQ